MENLDLSGTCICAKPQVIVARQRVESWPALVASLPCNQIRQSFKQKLTLSLADFLQDNGEPSK